MADNTEKFYELWEKASEAKTDKERVKLIRQALEVNPDSLDMKIWLLQITSDGTDKIALLEKLDALIEEEEKKLEKDDYFKDDTGNFWGIFETRPYMRALRIKLEFLIKLSRTKDAIKLAEYMIKLSENDNQGIRYILLALYALMIDEKGMKALVKKYKDEREYPSCMFLLPQAVLAYRLGKYKECDKLLDKISESNEDILPIIGEGMIFDDDENPDMYSPGSYEEAVACYFINERLLDSASDFGDYLFAKGYQIETEDDEE